MNGYMSATVQLLIESKMMSLCELLIFMEILRIFFLFVIQTKFCWSVFCLFLLFILFLFTIHVQITNITDNQSLKWLWSYYVILIPVRYGWYFVSPDKDERETIQDERRDGETLFSLRIFRICGRSELGSRKIIFLESQKKSFHSYHYHLIHSLWMVVQIFMVFFSRILFGRSFDCIVLLPSIILRKTPASLAKVNF